MKKILTLFLVIAMLFSLSSCGEKTSNDTVSNSKSVSKAITKADTIEELDELVLKDVTDTITALTTEFEKLSTDIATYDKYKTDSNKVKGFYDKVQNDTKLLCIRLREYSSVYAELILSSDKSFDDKYDEFDALYDSVYEDARDEIYDEIYDGILDDMYDVFYDGILDDAYDNIPYDEWSDARSDEYDLWSDTRSEVYDIWSDAGSDIYDFWSDMRGEMWDKDIEKAKEKLQDFKDDIEILYGKSSEQEKANNDSKNDEVAKETTSTQSSTDDKHWKQFLEDYENWVDDYIEIVKKYSENPTDTSILSDYSEMVTELAEWQTEAEKLEEELEDASPEELAEFSAELLKIAAKIAEATY